VTDPPLCSIAPVSIPEHPHRVGPGQEGIAARSGRQLVDDARLDDLPAGELAVVEQHHREASEIAGPGVESPARDECAVTVKEHVGLAFGSELGP
jgi:hypothetical protein